MSVSKTIMTMLEKGYKYCMTCGAWRDPCHGCHKCPKCGYSTWKHFPALIKGE